MHENNTPVLPLNEILDLVAGETFPSKRLTPLQRFRLACRRHGITVVERPRADSGLTWKTREEGRWIILGGDLREKHREFVAFHELGHALLPSSGRFNDPVDEFHADLFAYLALKPQEEE
jgi:Zn-dependent peptidase ImmA (M78 family)